MKYAYNNKHKSGSKQTDTVQKESWQKWLKPWGLYTLVTVQIQTLDIKAPEKTCGTAQGIVMIITILVEKGKNKHM